MRKLILKTGVAVVALTGLMLGLSAEARGNKPVVKPLSQDFNTSSKVVAEKTVTVVQNGTPGPSAPQGVVIQKELAELGPDGVVACPEDGTKSDAWQAVPEDIRANAKPGQCFARLLLAPQFEIFNERVMIADARTETHSVPEVAEWQMQDVLVQPERVMHKTVAAVSHTELATEVVKPAGFRDEIISARYETRVDHVMVQPERQVWVAKAGIPTGAALVTPGDHLPVRYRADGTLTWPGKEPVAVETSGEAAEYLQQGSAQTVYCLQIIPAVYEDRRVRVEVSPEQRRRIEIPAVTRQVRHVVVDVPEHEEEYTLPAVYKKQKVKVVITPAHTETTEIPAVYQDVEKKRITAGAQPVWREVLCDKNASITKVAEIQRELNKRGYNAGAVDGHLGPQTVSAMQKFQADHGLPQGQVSVEAVHALGIAL